MVVDFTVYTDPANIDQLEPVYNTIKTGATTITAGGLEAVTSSMAGYSVTSPNGAVYASEVLATTPTPARVSNRIVASAVASLIALCVALA